MLEIKNLTCGYTTKSILHDIEFKAEDGEFYGIIGPNGSGKTTFLRTISRILKPRKGAVLLDQQDIRKMGLKELARKMAFVPQSLEISRLTVEEFVLLGRIPYFSGLQFIESKEDYLKARQSMELTDVLHLKDVFIDQISGGERQLALIARALTQEPRLLLLDEPTSHLDISHQVKILDLLRRLNKELKITVMMVLHDLNLASEYCHKLVLINQGRIHRIGSPQEVLDYRIIEDVYKTIVVVENNPVSNKPYVLIVSEEARDAACLTAKARRKNGASRGKDAL